MIHNMETYERKVENEEKPIICHFEYDHIMG